jgi:hypothetical protein
LAEIDAGAGQPIDLRDVRVIEAGKHLRLAVEAREALRVAREGGRQNLERHVASQLRVARAIDLAHPRRRAFPLTEPNLGLICRRST